MLVLSHGLLLRCSTTSATTRTYFTHTHSYVPYCSHALTVVSHHIHILHKEQHTPSKSLFTGWPRCAHLRHQQNSKTRGRSTDAPIRSAMASPGPLALLAPSPYYHLHLHLPVELFVGSSQPASQFCWMSTAAMPQRRLQNGMSKSSRHCCSCASAMSNDSYPSKVTGSPAACLSRLPTSNRPVRHSHPSLRRAARAVLCAHARMQLCKVAPLPHSLL